MRSQGSAFVTQAFETRNGAGKDKVIIFSGFFIPNRNLFISSLLREQFLNVNFCIYIEFFFVTYFSQFTEVTGLTTLKHQGHFAVSLL